ncbi:amino acid ABC transporter membrane protein 1 (PAAT family) [Mesorhizobium sp. J18]|uniref:amino acid ABC transporter permease n=1 Tax=Mesorhizobium sp. J18 TaxID=935263 RepID=UPI00119C300D|nr:amino acid ABC transporter permease [Mesorhizobium sp. J18]TWG92356.1 amino acid ABC transporter membrane protein 1 (PAAT family) [Mesorhizobium sp. J18]
MIDLFLTEALPVFVDGIQATLFYALGCLVVGFPIAVLICAMRMSTIGPLKALATVYISFLRGVPLMVQLLISFYCLPVLGVNVAPWAAALFTLAICTSAYMAEILRGGFLGIPYGQIEAAQISGLTRRQILLWIQVPQAVRLTLPALVNEAVAMVKASSLISVVGVLDLTRAAQNVASSTYQPLTFYTVAGALYLVITMSVATGGRWLERRMAAGRR